MKSNTQLIEKSRFRRDYLFGRLVTAFGLLVLAIFATLIVHILQNALPLWVKPSFQSIDIVTLSTEDSAEEKHSGNNTESGLTPQYKQLGISSLQNNWVTLSEKNCSMQLTTINKRNFNVAKSNFAPACNKTILGFIDQQQQYIASLTQDNIIEIYRLALVNNTYQLLLQNSVKVPTNFSVANPQVWNVELNSGQLSIHTSYQNGVQNLHYNLGSLSEPLVLFFDEASALLPMSRFNQVLKVELDKLSVFAINNNQATLLQTIDIEGLPKSVSFSPSGLDLFVVTEQNSPPTNLFENALFEQPNTTKQILSRYTLFNKDGNFVFRPTVNTTLPDELASADTIDFAYDLRHNLIILIGDNGQTLLLNLVTGDIDALQKLGPNISDYHYSNEQLILKSKNEYRIFNLTDLQGLTSYQMLFGENDYSGYASQMHVWQTSVSSDIQSPKYGVLPLIMGSLKASVLALIVAFPLALGAAIYTAYFAPANVRRAIKPTIEMLEAIPSVIIGFIAAVWLAPFAEQYLISIFSVIILLPFVVLVIAFIHVFLQRHINQQKLGNWQLLINAALLLFAVAMIFLLSLLITDWSNTKGYDSLIDFVSNLTLSKTAIVVSLALGVAITPTIYTLIDDALFEVPDGVKQASFALGATKIQTLVKVVLIVALPSIISAVMLGFGRAFGETMIVLMVTGNTPIANWDLLSGLRTLTSNLAIELQEAPVDSTPYHILFLTAAILFAFTFIVNTFAALLKRRMYRHG